MSRYCLKVDMRSVCFGQSKVTDWESIIFKFKNFFFVPRMQIVDLCTVEDERDKLYEFFSELESDTDLVQFKTSGSTGAPKLISFTKNQIRTSVELTAKTFGLTGESLLLCPFSLDYVAGKMMVARAWYLGGQLIFTGPKRNPYEALQDHIPDFVALVPMQLMAILESSRSLKGLNQARNIIIGGAPISKKLERQIHNEVTVPCFQTFGMTETLTHFAIRSLNQLDQEFRALDGVSVKVDQNYRLKVQTPLSENWLQTNDMVELTSKGFIWNGRHDLVINSGGVKIHPEKIEKVLEHFFPKASVFASSIEHPVLGEECVLVVNVDRIIRRADMLGLLSEYEIPRKTFVAKDLPFLSNGKIDRTALKELCKKAQAKQLLFPLS